MTAPARLPASAREDHAKAAGAGAQRILTAAEKAILAAMTAAAAKVTTGSLTAQMGKRNVRIAVAAALGAASVKLQAVYGQAAEQVTAGTGPLPDAPGQVAAAILHAQHDADVAFGAVLAAAGADGARMPPPSSPYRRIVSRAQRGTGPGLPAARAALAAVTERGLTGYVSQRGRRWPLAAYGERAVRTATANLGRAPVMSEVTARRDQLLAAHVRAVTAAWNAAVSGLDPRDAVTAFRGDARVAGAGQQQQPGLLKRWRQEAARNAALIWLGSLWRQAGYAALLASLEGTVRDGMAEGEADALALAAWSQRLGGFSLDAAFRDALARLDGDLNVSREAQNALARMINGAAADVTRVLADAAGDASLGEITGAVDTFLLGDDVGAVARWTDQALWSAFGDGAVALYGRVGAGQFTGALVEVSWNVDSDPCPTCLANSDGSPYAPGDVPAYPGHPHCRCWLSSDTRLPVALLEPFLTGA